MIFLPLTFITGFFGLNFGWMTQIIGSADAFVLLGVILPTLRVALTLVWLPRSRLICWVRKAIVLKLSFDTPSNPKEMSKGGLDGDWFDENGDFPGHISKQVISRIIELKTISRTAWRPSRIWDQGFASCY
jgi:hypothetical protein